MASNPRGRRSIRLPGYDYGRPGAYFVTICTAGRRPLFGRLIGHQVDLSPLGRMVGVEWQSTVRRRRVRRLARSAQ